MINEKQYKLFKTKVLEYEKNQVKETKEIGILIN